MTSRNPPNGSVWNAPPNARLDVLTRLRAAPPSDAEIAAYREAARAETRERVEAYRTPITEETLRRNVG
jgi:hypothetical protein